MTVILKQIKEDVNKLVNHAQAIHFTEIRRHRPDLHDESQPSGHIDEIMSASAAYQGWYTQSLPVIRQLLPDRYDEFVEQYKIDKRKLPLDSLNYTISDYLLGVQVTRGVERVFDHFTVFAQKFNIQIGILKSALDRLDSRLADIRAVLQADLFDDELSAATELLRKGHLRASGAVAGVTLERHLSQVSANHAIGLRKSDPTIADLNDALKNGGILDVPNWRLIQRLGDIRNMCVHSKEREPTKDEVNELVDGAQKLVKTLF